MYFQDNSLKDLERGIRKEIHKEFYKNNKELFESCELKYLKAYSEFEPKRFDEVVKRALKRMELERRAYDRDTGLPTWEIIFDPDTGFPW